MTSQTPPAPLRGILAETDVPVCVTPAAGTDREYQIDRGIRLVNAAFSRLTGFGPDDLVGRDCRFMQGANRHQGARRRIRSAIASGLGTRVMMSNYRSDGSAFDNLLTLIPLVSGEGRAVWYLGASFDVPPAEKASAFRAKTAALARLRDTINVALAGSGWRRIELPELFDPDPHGLIASRLVAFETPEPV